MYIPKKLALKVEACNTVEKIQPLVAEGGNHLLTHGLDNSLPESYKQRLLLSSPDHLTGEGVAAWFEGVAGALQYIVTAFGDDSREKAALTTYASLFIQSCTPEARAKVLSEIAIEFVEGWQQFLYPPAYKSHH